MIKDYIKLIKFQYHVLFISVLFGFFLFIKDFQFILFLKLLYVYVSFNMFLYTGFYTINDIFDVESDKKHPNKKFRPIASGAISVKTAWIFSISFILIGLIMAWFLGKIFFYFYLLFWLLNILYTTIFKKIPYVEIVANAITHPLRLMLGGLIVGYWVPWEIFIAYLFVASFISINKRVIEIKANRQIARKVLYFYTVKILNILKVILIFGFLSFFIFGNHENNLFYILITLFLIFLEGSFIFSLPFYSFFKKITYN